MAKSMIRRAYDATRKLPDPLANKAFTTLFGSVVKYAGTSEVQFVDVDLQRVELTMKNKRKVQNHIGSVHAVAISLLAESASGSIVALNLSDDKLALCKSMHVDFTKRAKGDMRAVAVLTDEQVKKMNDEPRGNVTVSTTVTDADGKNPVEVEFVWAWVQNK